MILEQPLIIKNGKICAWFIDVAISIRYKWIN
jgi:hypothetical protein